MANAPALLRGSIDLNRAIKRSHIDRRITERISLAVQESIGCDYCLGRCWGLPMSAYSIGAPGRRLRGFPRAGRVYVPGSPSLRRRAAREPLMPLISNTMSEREIADGAAAVRGRE